MINSVGGPQMTLPGIQTPRAVPQERAQAAGEMAAPRQVENDSTHRTGAPEAPTRSMAEAKGLFVDIYA